MTRRQMLDFKLDIPERLSTACQVFGALGLLAALGAAPGFQQVEITAAVAIALEVTHVREQRIVRLLAAEPIQGAVGKDALKEHRQLVGRFVPIVLGQSHHAVLHDVQGRFLVANVVQRALEGTLVHALEEVG